MEFQEHLDEVIRSFSAGTWHDIRYQLESLRPQEVANLLESMPHKMRRVVWGLLDEDTRHQTLPYLSEEVRSEFLEDMNTEELLSFAGDMELDDFADLLQQLPDRITRELLNLMDARDRARVEAVLSYPEDSAGGIMNTDTITVRPRHTLGLVLRYLRRQERLPESTDSLIVVNERDEYLGVLPLTKILTTDTSVTVREVMNTDVEAIPVEMRDTEVAHIFADHDLVSSAVVDRDGHLLGRITIDDVVDVIIEDADEAVMSRAGLEFDEDTFAPVAKSARRRAVWLGINLITALVAAAVISRFQDVIAQVVALAVLMPVVASMGGIAGTQTLTLVIRGQALGQISSSNLSWLLNRELMVALLNGMVWALLLAVGTALVFDDTLLAALIAIAIVINLAVAALAGGILPLLLQRLGIDPVLAGGVVLTTITDVAGFFVFLGLAAWAYT